MLKLNRPRSDSFLDEFETFYTPTMSPLFATGPDAYLRPRTTRRHCRYRHWHGEFVKTEVSVALDSPRLIMMESRPPEMIKISSSANSARSLHPGQHSEYGDWALLHPWLGVLSLWTGNRLSMAVARAKANDVFGESDSYNVHASLVGSIEGLGTFLRTRPTTEI
ncbi:hypothetical protein BD779DRAFT_1469508 [Infundibulicybe gibba]|nr:hypothetical protein BD779DRAFT_1469508 [Infundibulicybe gibba]